MALKQILGAYSENIFAQYIYKTLPLSTSLFAFKKRLCAQMGLHAMVGFAMSLSGRTPSRILFSRGSGNVLMTDFYPQYSTQTCVMSHSETVPFRLTRNLHSFFTVFGIEGTFVSAMTLLSVAAVQPRSNIGDFLHLTFRDDLTSWQVEMMVRQLRSMKDGAEGGLTMLGGGALKEAVGKNADMAIGKFARVAPRVMVHALEGQQGSAPGSPHLRYLSGDRPGVSDDVMGTAKKLVEIATDTKNLCIMELSWVPWY